MGIVQCVGLLTCDFFANSGYFQMSDHDNSAEEMRVRTFQKNYVKLYDRSNLHSYCNKYHNGKKDKVYRKCPG